MRVNIKDTNWEVLIWVGTFAVLGFVGLFAMYSYHTVEKEMAAQFNEEQRLLARQTAMGIGQYMGDIANVLNLTSSMPSIAGGNAEDIKLSLKNAYDSLKNQVIIVFWEDTRGIFQDHYPRDVLPGIEGKDYSFRTYFRVAKEMKVPFVSDIVLVGGEHYKEIPGRFESFIVAYPLIGPDGEFNGVLGCAIDLANITARYVAPIQPSETGYAWMIDETGMVLYHPNPAWVGMNLYDIVMEMKKEGVKGAGVECLIQGIKIKDEGTCEILFPHYPSNVLTKKLVAFSSVHFLNRRWITVASSPYKEVVSLMSGTFRNTLALGSVSISFIFAATFVMLRINRARIKAHEGNKWANKVLLEHKRLQTIFNGVPHYLVMVNQGYIIIEINQRFCDLYGKSAQELIGKHCHYVLRGRRNICDECLAKQAFQAGELISDRERHIEIMGKPYFMDMNAIPLFGSKGEVSYVVIYAVDITEKKALTEKLIQAEKLAVAGQMSAHVAHEIRNPLAAILLHSELLEDEISSDNMDTTEATTLIESIKGEIGRLSQFTDEYLSYTRLPQPKKQPVNPAEEVSSAIAMMTPELEGRGIKVTFNPDNDTSEVDLDRGQFRQVLINLIKNSADAMPSGGRIGIFLMEVKGNFLLLLKDTGYGIPQELERRIFDPYFTTKENGTGLGLALVQYVANAHNGWVDVESQEGSGTTFIFSVPLHGPDQEGV
ncbi:MAG: cache domain-containing protein [Thermodesulfobacteriota bacterium]|nr:cache domain-containing protein [Thermodesulfobacteriota bacterium]